MHNNNHRIGGRLTLLFVVAYLSHGLASQFGLLAQPVQYFLKQELHMTAAQVSTWLSLMMLPWVLKPFFALLCDCFPLFGYRRKSYLILANVASALAFGAMAVFTGIASLFTAFVVGALFVAGSTAVTVGLAVEAGRDEHQTRSYFSLQTMCYYGALIAASLIAGQLCRWLAPNAALHTAALLSTVPPLLVALLAWFQLREKRITTGTNAAVAADAWAQIRKAFKTKTFWLAALFIWLWDFSPSFGVPLYFHQTNDLHFSQEFVGVLNALTSVGMLLGAFAYRFWLQRLTLRTQLYTVVTLGVLATLAYLLLGSPASAVGLELARGFCSMLAILAIYALAADVCPPGAEVSVMAMLIAVRNIGLEGSTWLGGVLFTHAFANTFWPLVLVAAATTALCWLIIPAVTRRCQR